jgi:PAS domain S-box-containing protein
LPDTEATPAECALLIERLADSECDREVRVHAASRLGEIASAAAAAALIAVLPDPSAAVRAAAAAALGSIGAPATTAARPLIEALRDSSRTMRVAAAGALADIDPELSLPIGVVREALADEEPPFRAAYDASSVPTAFVDSRGYVMRVNPAFHALARELGDACSVTPWTPLVSGDIRDAIPGWDGLLAGDEPASQAEMRVRAPSGRNAWILLNASRVAEPAVDTPCVSVGFQDITAIKRTQILHEVMYEISEAAHTSADVPKLLRSTYGSLTKLMSATDLAVLLVDTDSDGPVEQARWLSTENNYVSADVSVLNARARRVLTSGAPLWFTETETLDLVAAGEMDIGASPAGAWIGAPMLLDDRCIGVLRLRDDEHRAPYSEDDAEVLTFVGRQVATAIGRQEAYARLAEERRLFQALMDNVPDRVFFKTPTSEYLRINRAMADALSLADPSDAVGQTGFEFRDEAEALDAYNAEQEALERGTPVVGRVFPDTLTGRPERWVQSTKIPLQDDAGNSVGLVGITRDVTDLVDAQEGLRALNAELEQRAELRAAELRQEADDHAATRESLERVVQTARCLLWEATVEEAADGLVWHFEQLNSEAVQRLMPLQPKAGETVEQAMFRSRLREDATRMAERAEQALRSGEEEYSQDCRAIDAHGSLRWLREDVYVISGEAGRWRVVGVTADVTNRRRAEEDLRRSEERFRRLFDESPLGMAIVGRDRRVVEANATLAGMLGYEKGDLASKPLRDIVHPDDLARPAQPTGAVERGQRPTYQMEARYLRRDESSMWGRVTSSAVYDDRGAQIYDVHMIEDITEERHAIAVRVAMQDISDAARTEPTLSAMYRRIHIVLQTLIEAPGLSVALRSQAGPDMYDVTWVDLSTPFPSEAWAVSLAGSRTAIVADSGEPLYMTADESREAAERRDIDLHGSKPAAWLGVPLVADGRAIGVLRVLNADGDSPYTPQDVEMMTYAGQQIALAIDHRRTQDALDHERHLFASLMDSTADAIYFKDTESRFIRVNHASAAQLRDSAPDDVVGRTDADYNATSRGEEFLEEERRMFETGEPLIGKLQHEIGTGHLAGTEKWTHVTKLPMRDEAGEIVGLVGVNRDVTELVRAQEALTESERQRAMLVQRIVTVQEEEQARIARELHDQVGQELTSVLLGLRAAERVPIADAFEFIETARTQTSETLETVRRIAFDMHPSSMEDVGLAAALERDLVILGEQAGISTAFRATPAGEEPDLSKERQVGLYRIVHAALTNTVRHSSATSVSVVLSSTSELVSVMVDDDGVGFDVDVVNAGPVEGRFGLLAMDERALMLKGSISVESSPGEGTAVFIELPTDRAF